MPCWSRNSRKVSPLGARNDACWKFDGDVDLHRADQERTPGEQQQRQELALRQHRADAGRGDHLPGRAGPVARSRGSDGSPGRGWAFCQSYSAPTARANASSSVGTLGPQVPHLQAVGSRHREDRAGLAVAGHEHPHHVVVGVVSTRSRRRAAAPIMRSVPSLTRSSNTCPFGPFTASMVPWVATRALVHHHDVVAGELDVGQQVRRQDQVHALVVGEVADQLEHLVAALRVHAVGRLVEEEQVGIVDQRLGQLDPLLHAGGIGLDVAVARLAQAHVVEHLVRALHRVGARQPGQLPAVGDEGHRGHAGDVRVGLRHVADAAADLERLGRDVEPEHAHLAFGGRDETRAAP